jgi:hypothetical protein
MHDEVIRYSMAGELPDSKVVQSKERMMHFLTVQMKESGCVPILDLAPHFTLDYHPERETFAFELSMYGVFIGKEAAWQAEGLMNGTVITSTTPRTKSKESSDTVE